ncbi:MAG: cytochrome P450 [Chloroflexota bacterium]
MSREMTINFEPNSYEFRANPYPVYEELRKAGPLFYWPENDAWVVVQYDACNQYMRDQRIGFLEYPPNIDPDKDPIFAILSRWMVIRNPPDHTRLRGLVQKAFTPRRVENLRTKVEQIAGELVDTLIERAQSEGSADVIDTLTYPLPVNVIAELLGVPVEDHNYFREWTEKIIRFMDVVDEPGLAADAKESARKMRAYFERMAEERRTHPRDDLLSALLQVEEAGERLDIEELYANCALLLIAGHETTVHMLGNGLLRLLQNPAQLEMLRQDPHLTAGAVEEMLRYDGPVHLTAPRFTLEEMEICGQHFAPKTKIRFLLGSANRDDTQFHAADTFDITRNPNPHLSFVSGIHYCLGAPLARFEAIIALNALLSRVPNLGLADKPLEYRNNFVIRGLTELHVTV